MNKPNQIHHKLIPLQELCHHSGVAVGLAMPCINGRTRSCFKTLSYKKILLFYLFPDLFTGTFLVICRRTDISLLAVKAFLPFFQENSAILKINVSEVGSYDYILSNLQPSYFPKFEFLSHHAAEPVAHKLIIRCIMQWL